MIVLFSSLALAGSLTQTDAADFAAGSFDNTTAASAPGDVVLSRVISNSGEWIDGGTSNAMMLQKDDATWFDTAECPYYPAGVLTDDMTVSGLPFRAGPHAYSGRIAGMRSGVAIDMPSGANYVDAAHILHPGGRCNNQTHTFTWTYTDGSTSSVSYTNTWDCQRQGTSGTNYSVNSQGAVGTGPCCQEWYEAEFTNPNPGQLVDSVSMTYNDACGGAYLGQIWAVTLEVSGDDYSALSAGSTEGSFTSSVLDSGVINTRWDNLSWSATLGGSDSVTLAVRSGPVASPDASWSAWSAEQSAAAALSGVSGRYIQVRATFSANDASTALHDFTLLYAVDADGDGYFDDVDCDDLDSGVNSGGTEVCDGIDNDCDGSIDGAAALDATVWYADGDGDGSGDAASPLRDCQQPSGYVPGTGDCDDTNPNAYTGNTEVCDGADNDCDGAADEPDAADAAWWYADGDGDGYGLSTTTQRACAQPSGYAGQGGDCDDGNAAFHPGAGETDCADPNDYNCDGSVGYADADSDGVAACQDCDDSNPAALPGGAEVCDGADNDCNGTADGPEASDASTWYADSDSDGYGDDESTSRDCTQPDGTSAQGGDCDDTTAAVHPGAEDLPGDGLDQDCDGADAEPTDSPGDDTYAGDDSPTPDDSPLDSGEGGDKTCGCSSGAPGGGAALVGLVALLRRRPRGD